MEEYKSNSYRSKEQKSGRTEERPKREKIVTGGVQSRKKSTLRKFTDLFVAEDFATMKRYLISDLIIPKAKEVISEGIDSILYGEGARKKQKQSNRTPYRSYWEKQNEPSGPSTFRSGTGGYELDDIILNSRGDAEQVLIQMDDIVESYGVVSVADLYDLVGITTNNYMDCKYGWTTNIRNASVVRGRQGGYMLKFPRPMPIN